MVDSFSNLIIETIGSDFDVLNSAAAFEMGWDHELMQRIQCCIYALINNTRIAIDEYCSFGLWMCCSVRWKPSISELADGACCKREESMNKVHSLLNNSKSSMTNHKNRSVGILLHGSEPQEDTSLNFEGYWNAKHPGGIAIKIKICTSWTEIPGSEGQRWILGLKNVKCLSTKIPPLFLASTVSALHRNAHIWNASHPLLVTYYCRVTVYSPGMEAKKLTIDICVSFPGFETGSFWTKTHECTDSAIRTVVPNGS